MTTEDPTIGSLRRRVTLVDPHATAAIDPDGQPLPVPADVATVWAAVDPVSGDDPFVGAHAETAVTHVITLRWREDVRAGASRWQARCGPRRFEGKAAMEHAGNVRFLKWYVVEVFDREAA